ncbi:hypothetical protein TRFO_15709 [Tritrichomonas foetus]|uniref:Beige/BEACH domain containing protein n=1 Tax=Tritrichomonas foetus TaxID=1144522 RepID=A0A1J4KRQ3_9EUKA|nr:hypothetical protein TRFO_15709 [Tritrichomonas foetus]|eukprot:OHT13951.1 hypothetical protein TRFO_15709 [Tritrichomonas foetus]
MLNEKSKKEDHQLKNVINSFTNTLIEINKMNNQRKTNQKLVDAIYFFHNIQTLQPDILKTNKKFAQLSFTFLETTLNFFSKFTISQQFMRAIVRNFVWFIESTGNIPQSQNYIDLVSQITFNFPNIKDDREITEFFITAFQVPTFISSLFFSNEKSLDMFVNFFFMQIKNIDSVSFMIQILRNKAVFPSNADSSAYTLIHIFADEFRKNKNLNEKLASNSIHFISAYMEKLAPSYPPLINQLFITKDVDVFYEYLTNHAGDSFVQFISSLISIPSENGKIPSQQVFHFLLTELFKTSISSSIQLQLLQSMYYFISEYHVDFGLIEPPNFFVTIFNIPTHLEDQIHDFLLDFLDLLASNNYEYTFFIFTHYLLEFGQNSPLERLSKILKTLMLTPNLLDANSLQSLPTFFKSFKTPESFGKFLDKYPSFQMLLVLLFQQNTLSTNNEMNLENESEIVKANKIEWLNKVVDSADYFDHSNILIQMLTVEPSGYLIDAYISILKTHFKPSLFDVLTTTLQQSYFLVGQFLLVHGLQTIDRVLPILDDELVTRLLVSLSSHPFSDELNQNILNLPEDHHFFHLKKESYHKILRNCPIRLPVFLPFVNIPPVTFSQYDLVNISKYAIPIYQRLNKKIPLVFDMANRYVTIQYANEIINDSTISFNEIIDLNCDHFPIYEFLPSSQSVSINIENDKKSLIFWFKIVSPVYQGFVIFHDSNRVFFLDGDVLNIINGNSNSPIKSIPIERNAWHFVTINYKFVRINKQIIYMQDSAPIKKFVFGQNNCNSLWCLSPNIRLIETKDMNNFYKKGHKYFSKSETLLHLPNDALLVTYSGLPFYFKNPQFLHNYLNLIENCEDSERFINLLSLLFDIMVINDSIEQNWPFVLTILERKISILTKYTICFILEFITKYFTVEIFSDFILNFNFWRQLPDLLLGYTLHQLLFLTNRSSSLIFNFFSVLLKTITEDSKKQLILFFLTKLSVQFPDESYMKMLIELILFSPTDENEIFSQNVKIFFIQTALQIDFTLTSVNLPNDWVLKLLSNESDEFYFTVFELMCNLNNNDCHFEFPSFIDVTPFVSNFRHWHYMFALMTGKHPLRNQRLINSYYPFSIAFPSIIPTIISLVFHGLAIYVQLSKTNENLSNSSHDEGLNNQNKGERLYDMKEQNNSSNRKELNNEAHDFLFLFDAINDALKILTYAIDKNPKLFRSKTICEIIQYICPLIPNLGVLLTINAPVSLSEKYSINLNELSQISVESMKAWKIDENLQNVSHHKISNFSLQSHSIHVPTRKCENFQQKIQNLANKFGLNLSVTHDLDFSFAHILDKIGFVEFSVQLLIANEENFLQIVYFLLGFHPFLPINVFEEYFVPVFKMLITQLTDDNNNIQISSDFFEKILLMMVEGYRNGILRKAIDSSYFLIFNFIDKALDCIPLKSFNNTFSTNLNNIYNNLNPNFNNMNISITTNNNSSNNNLIALVRELVIILTSIAIQKIPNDVVSILLGFTNIINNEVIFESPQMVCLMLSSLHVFLFQKNDTFSKLLNHIWPRNQTFQKFFISTYSNELFDAFQEAVDEEDNTVLISYLTKCPKSFDNFVDSSKTTLEESIFISEISNACLIPDYPKCVYKLELLDIQNHAHIAYHQTVVEYLSKICVEIYLNLSAATTEKIYLEYQKLLIHNQMQDITNKNMKVSMLCFPLWMSRILSPSFDFQTNSNQIFHFNQTIQSSQTNQQNKNDRIISKNWNFIQFFQDADPIIFMKVFSMVYIKSKEIKAMFNAKIIRENINFPVSLFLVDSKIYLLVNSKIENEKLTFLEDNVSDFSTLVKNNNFGKYSFFNSYSLLEIPLKNILNVFLFGESIQISSFHFASFILHADKKNITDLFNLIKPFSKTNHHSFYCQTYLNKITLKKILTNYENNKLTNFEFIILLNALNGRTFIDFKNLPLFPQPKKKLCQLKRSLYTDSNAAQYYTPDFYDSKNDSRNLNDVNLADEETSKDFISTVFDNFEKLDSWEFFSPFVKSIFKDQLKGLLKRPELNQLRNNTKLKEKILPILSNSSHLFAFRNTSLENINLSRNGTFVVIDNLDNSFSEVFRIYYFNEHPIKAKHISLFNFYNRSHKPLNKNINIINMKIINQHCININSNIERNKYLKHSIVNEHDLIALSYSNRIIIIWDFVRGVPLNEIKVKFDIIDAMFEETFGLVVLCSNNAFYVYTVNLTFIEMYECQDSISKILSFDELKIEYKCENSQVKGLYFDPSSLVFVPLC